MVTLLENMVVCPALFTLLLLKTVTRASSENNNIIVPNEDVTEDARGNTKHERYLRERSVDFGEVGAYTGTVIQTVVQEKSMGNYHRFDLSESVEYYVKFLLPKHYRDNRLKGRDAERYIFQVDFNSSDATDEYPVDVTIRQLRRLVSYQLPAQTRDDDGRLVYKSNQRSVDLCSVEEVDENTTITVSLATTSRKKVKIDVKVFIKGQSIDWKRKNSTSGETFVSKTTITPTQARTRYFKTQLIDSDSIMIKVRVREDNVTTNRFGTVGCLCSVVSIQQPQCNFQDTITIKTPGSIMRKGIFSTMLNVSAIILDPKDYPDGFLIVLVASPLDGICNIEEDRHRCTNLNGNNTEPMKRIEITVSSNGSEGDYAIAILTVIGVYSAIITLTVIFSAMEFTYKKEDFEHWKETIDGNLKKIRENLGMEAAHETESVPRYHLAEAIQHEHMGVVTSLATGRPLHYRPPISPTSQGEESDETDVGTPLRVIVNPEVKSKYEGEEAGEKIVLEKAASVIAGLDDLKKMDINTKDSKAARMNKHLHVSDLSSKLHNPTRTKSVYQKSQLYVNILMLISIYYSLPVMQMVFRFSWEQTQTGNQDICYYNDLCRKPLAGFRDFNHVFSNLGYLVFGVCFMCIILFKKWKHEKFLKENQFLSEDMYGVPQQYGLFFAMGLALSMEGVMSSCYHVCPTDITFQFDTTFMYLMSVLMFLKLYQVRHPDVSANAVGVFFGLGVALILETVSCYYSGTIFWIIFCGCYFIFMAVVTVHAYNLGAVRYDYKILWAVCRIIIMEIHKICQVCGRNKSGSTKCLRIRPRLICIIVTCLINMLLCCFFAISHTSGASNYLLAIFMLNLGLYTMYYCIMKIACDERINKVPLTYTFLGLLCFFPAMYLFTKKEKKSEISPAESRSLNVECMFMGFYDGHDIWHFLGGAGVFFAFMFYLTLDEDLKYKKRNTINVF